MLDLGFAVAYIVLLVLSVVAARSITITAVTLLATVGISGAALQFLGVGTYSISFRGLQVWLLVTLGVVAVVCWRMRGKPRWSRSTIWVMVGPAILIAVAFLASRLLAPGSPNLLSAVGYLIERSSAEDNAKWLNASASLADGSAVTSWASVGGPLVLVLTLCATLIGSASVLFYGSVNQVAVASGTLILAETLLIILAPFAVAPIIERLVGKRGARRRIPWPVGLLTVAILSASVAVLLTFGHLTLQYTLLTLTVWVGVFLAPIKGFAARTLASLGVATAAMVWFPLNVLAVFVLLGLIASSLRGLLLRRAPVRNAATLAATIVVSILLAEFLGSSIRFALGVDAPVAHGMGGAARGIAAINTPRLPLFDDPGGTEVLTATMALLAVLAVIGAVVQRSKGQGASWRLAVPFIPVAALAGYASIISLADFWAVGSGPNYASLKVVFAAGIPILVCCLPFALLALDPSATEMTMLRWTAVLSVAVLLTLDTLFPRAVMQVKPSKWPSTAGSPYWSPAEVQSTGVQPLDSNPIGCVVLPQGAAAPTVLPNGQTMYACTRLLTGVAGLDAEAGLLVKWQLDEWLQNTSLWDAYAKYLVQLDPNVLDRRVIILDANKQVIGLETLRALLERFPSQDPVTASG